MPQRANTWGYTSAALKSAVLPLYWHHRGVLLALYSLSGGKGSSWHHMDPKI